MIDLVSLGKAMTNHKYKVSFNLNYLNMMYGVSVLIRADGRVLNDEVKELPRCISSLGELIMEMVRGADGKAKDGFYK